MKTMHLLLCVVVAATLFACDRNVTYTETSQEPATCFNCHSDDDTRLIAARLQWENSFHASGLNTNRSTTPCNACHTSEGFKALLETGTLPANVDNPTAIHCFTCHAPHTNGDFRLRVEQPVALEDGVTFDLGRGNLCVACHHARENVNTFVGTGTVNVSSVRWGPHYSQQGDMLIGTNGYHYAGYTYTQTNHRGATDNGCVDCHMKFTRNSKVGGHTWNMRWTDEEGEILNTAACVPCHGTTSNFNIDDIQTEIAGLEEELRTLLVGAGFILANGNRVVGTRTADEAGAIWNYLMVHYDRSAGVHNPNYIRDLLQSSIDFMSSPAQTVSRAPGSSGGSK